MKPQHDVALRESVGEDGAAAADAGVSTFLGEGNQPVDRMIQHQRVRIEQEQEIASGVTCSDVVCARETNVLLQADKLCAWALSFDGLCRSVVRGVIDHNHLYEGSRACAKIDRRHSIVMSRVLKLMTKIDKRG